MSLNIIVAENYLQLLRNMNPEAKQYIIDQLKKSLSGEAEKIQSTTTAFGAWVDERSSEEIIEDIYSSRISQSDREPLQ